jgi:WD40 repeat protein
LLTYTGHDGEVEALAWTHDGRYLASGGDDATIQVWNARSGQLHTEYLGHTDIIYKLAWSPDGKTLASASQDGTVKLWKSTL